MQQCFLETANIPQQKQSRQLCTIRMEILDISFAWEYCLNELRCWGRTLGNLGEISLCPIRSYCQIEIHTHTYVYSSVFDRTLLSAGAHSNFELWFNTFSFPTIFSPFGLLGGFMYFLFNLSVWPFAFVCMMRVCTCEYNTLSLR